MVVTLSDAPDEVVDAATGDKNLLVVHQQDIQAVVNAMWEGGAEAVVLQGQRMVSTTGIKCEGNSVVIQGVPYPQPYVIEAVGDVGDLTSAIADDDYLQVYREQADDPKIDVGWDLDIEDELTAPAYDGLLDLSYATPVTPSGAGGRLRGRSLALSRRRAHGGGLGRESAGSSGCRRRRRRRLVRRHEQRDRRPLRLRLTTGRQLVGDRAPRLGRPVVATDVVLEARVHDLLDRVGAVQPDHVRDQVRTLADRDRDDGCPAPPAGRPPGRSRGPDPAARRTPRSRTAASSLAVRSRLRASSWVDPHEERHVDHAAAPRRS